MKKLATSAALALAVSVGSAGLAHATTYILNADGCTGGCGYSSYGTVDVTGDGTNTLTFTIALDPHVYFNQAGKGHDATYWDIVGGPDITVAGLPIQFAANGPQSAGSYHASAFGDFDYINTWQGPPTNNGTLGVQNLTFTVTGSGPLTLGSEDKFGEPVYFVVNVVALNSDGVASTGLVGATLGVPEPAGWGLMLVGFGGLGAMLRRRRNATQFA